MITHTCKILIYFFFKVNFKISPKQFHWNTESGIRAKSAKQMTNKFTLTEQSHLKNYPIMPSPRGDQWKAFVQHRIKMHHPAMKAYARPKYARLMLSKRILTQRERDLTAKRITKNQPSIIFCGGVEMAPNSPIGIKKNRRCPGTRHLETSVKKLGHSDFIRVNEDYTSQTCATCHNKFPKTTKKHRFKVCSCPRTVEQPPPVIVTNKSSRQKQYDRWKSNDLAKTAEKARAEIMRLDSKKQNDCSERRALAETVKKLDEDIARLVSKKTNFNKEWLLNATNHQMENAADQERRKPSKIVWHRDIVAAKCMLYKGKHCLNSQSK